MARTYKFAPKAKQISYETTPFCPNKTRPVFLLYGPRPPPNLHDPAPLATTRSVISRTTPQPQYVHKYKTNDQLKEGLVYRTQGQEEGGNPEDSVRASYPAKSAKIKKGNVPAGWNGAGEGLHAAETPPKY
ncbi:hypothetical protein GWI33_005883 [Rhynchophorus ferrugineus]|uniref:Uncharacterized protein n=1 Tax=Rhynchophorus ferrugineus TaxID=354439 RepID=A0A834IGN1_RHYFE|nr:hypothetical protein GWI33_005883 [Rhynchophorus ferrugineus]